MQCLCSKVVVSGASDDLIEVEGDFVDEYCSCEPVYVIFSNGTVLKVEYTDDGLWKISTYVKGMSKITRLYEATVDGYDIEDDKYSDVVEVEGCFTFVLFIKVDESMFAHRLTKNDK